MEDIPKGPDPFFRLSPAGSGEARYFAVRRGDVNQVANVAVLLSEHYGDLKALALCQYPLGSVGDMLSVVQDGLYGVRNYVADGVPLLGVGNVTEEGLDLSEVKRITFEEHKRLAASQVAYGDLLVTITGRLGTAAIYDSVEPANLSAHVALCRAKPQHELRYLQHYLASRLGAASLTKATIGSTHPHINVNRLVELPIPLPSRPEQREVSDKMDAARAERKTKLAEADALLTGVDDFLLDALGITPPPKESRRVFAVRRGDVKGLSLGVPLYAPELRHYLNKLRINPAVTKPLSAYVEVNPRLDISGMDADTLVGFIPMYAVSDGATGEYTVTNRPLKEVSKGYTPFINGDILWAKITPCMQNGKSCVVDGLPNGVGFGSTEFHVLRVRSAEISKEFVMEFVSQAWLRRVATYAFTGSAGQQRVPAAFLEALPFPELSEARQNEIVALIKAVREEARRLRAEAEADWQAAKRWFEEQLSGPTP